MYLRNGFKLAILFLLLGINGVAQELHVGDGQTYATIQAAIDAVTNGDKIVIHEGTYREEVELIVNGIEITSNPGDKVVISGSEPLLNWEEVGEGVYKTYMNWDVTEADQANQVFVDGEMLFNARWPNRTQNFVTAWEEGILDDADDAVGFSSIPGYNKKIDVYDEEFTEEPAARWLGANFYMNLSNPTHKKDGQGNTGVVYAIDGNAITFVGKGLRSYEQDVNWGIDTDTRYYLFNPTPEGVEATGGVTALLDPGEWWKNGDTLFVKLPNGEAPAASIDGTNLVEAKKYPFAFRPGNSSSTYSDITIRDLDFFATSITTDEDFWNQKGTSLATNNTFDNLNFKYNHHTENCAGDWQVQWSGKSGFILSGENNIIKNSSFEYSAASAISVLGEKNTIFNCIIHDVNYMVTESGGINFNGRNSTSTDNVLAYNTIYNTTHAAISTRNFRNSDPLKKGVARMHHNLLYNAAQRAYDVGYFDGGSDKQWSRFDHNIIYGSPEDLIFGIYIDFGSGRWTDPNATYYPARFIIDHNVIFNMSYPIGINGADDLQIFNNTVLTSSVGGRGIPNGLDMEKHAFNTIVKNNISQVGSDWSVNGVVSNNILPESSGVEFNDLESKDLSLTVEAVEAIDKGVFFEGFNGVTVGLPDLGAYEYGLPKWIAGASENGSFALNIESANGTVNYMGKNEFPAGVEIVIEATGNTGYGFTEWTGDITSTENPLIVTMDQDISITANYETVDTYTLTLLDDNNGSIEQFPDKSSYNSNTIVTLTPKANLEDIYEFDTWEGDVPAGDIDQDPLLLLMDGNKEVTATFKRRDLWYELTETYYTNYFSGSTYNSSEIEWSFANDVFISYGQNEVLTIRNIENNGAKIVHSLLLNGINISGNPILYMDLANNADFTLAVDILDEMGNGTGLEKTLELTGDNTHYRYEIDFSGASNDLSDIKKITFENITDDPGRLRLQMDLISLGRFVTSAGDAISYLNLDYTIFKTRSGNLVIDRKERTGEADIKIIDLTGRTLLHQITDQSITNISTGANINPGVYLINITENKSVYTQKILLF